MASKKELVDKIQAIAKRVYAAKTAGETSIEAQEDTFGITPDDVNFEEELFPVLANIILNVVGRGATHHMSDIKSPY